jgi:hypothetical protein
LTDQVLAQTVEPLATLESFDEELVAPDLKVIIRNNSVPNFWCSAARLELLDTDTSNLKEKHNEVSFRENKYERWHSNGSLGSRDGGLRSSEHIERYRRYQANCHGAQTAR